VPRFGGRRSSLGRRYEQPRTAGSNDRPVLYVCAVRVVGRGKIDPKKSVVLSREKLREADFSGRRLEYFSSEASRLEACRFDKARIESASFGAGRAPSEYLECSFDGARIRFGPGGFARFVRCSFRDVDLRDWFCFAVELVDCVFTGRLRHSFFNGTVPEDQRAFVGRKGNEFRGNDFSGMKLEDVSFRTGIDLTQQRLPSGPEYIYLPDPATAVQRARAEVVHWDDLDRRREAMVFINGLEEDVEKGQRQLLLRPDDYSRLPKDAKDALEDVFTLLRASA
jgi:hypothetical protein